MQWSVMIFQWDNQPGNKRPIKSVIANNDSSHCGLASIRYEIKFSDIL